MLTQDRVDILTAYLSESPEKATSLLSMEPEEALKKINADGYDFTLDEMYGYAFLLKQAKSEGELDPDELESVAGGFGLIAAGCCIAGGILLGIAVNAKW